MIDQILQLPSRMIIFGQLPLEGDDIELKPKDLLGRKEEENIVEYDINRIY